MMDRLPSQLVVSRGRRGLEFKVEAALGERREQMAAAGREDSEKQQATPRGRLLFVCE